MDNNKNRRKDRPKSNPELRKINPRDFSDAGMIDGQKAGIHNGGHEKTREDKT